MRSCRYEDCDRAHFGQGWCSGHYEQVVRNGKDPVPLRAVTREHPALCTFPGCDRPYSGRGLCGGHLAQQARGKELSPLRGHANGKTCSGPECDRPVIAKGLCTTHYDQSHKGKDLTVIGAPIETVNTGKTCYGPECVNPAMARGLCSAHRRILLEEGELRVLKKRKGVIAVCSFPGCARQRKGVDGLCSSHHKQKKAGRELAPIKPKGRQVTRIVNGKGYVLVWRPDHPNAFKSGWVLEHTVVMSGVIGRPLLPHENVHHVNGDRSCNDRSNLQLWSTSQPKGQRAQDKLAWAREIIDLYGPIEDVL